MERLRKKQARRQRIKRGIRKTIKGTPERPRLTVFRSNKEIYVQLIDDTTNNTILAVNSLQKDLNPEDKTKSGAAAAVGALLAEKAKEANIERVVFDRNGYLYHGRIKAVAEGARKGGLKF